MLLKRQAAKVHLHLSPDTPPSIVPAGNGSNSIIFIWILLDIFLVPEPYYHFVRKKRGAGATHLLKQSSYTTRLAGEKMQAMIHSKTEASGTSMLPSVVGDVIGSLARTVAGAENNAYIIHAAMIQRHLCGSYPKEDENLQELKKAMSSVMPEVINLCTNI